MSRSWWFSATRDARGEDETVSGVWRSHLQKWRALHFIQRLVVSLFLLVYVCRLLAASRMAMKFKRYEQEWNWLFAATCGERREDRTLSGFWRWHLQKWRAFRFKKRSLILLFEIVYVCRRIAVSGMATKCERYEEQVVANSDSW